MSSPLRRFFRDCINRAACIAAPRAPARRYWLACRREHPVAPATARSAVCDRAPPRGMREHRRGTSRCAGTACGGSSATNRKLRSTASPARRSRPQSARHNPPAPVFLSLLFCSCGSFVCYLHFFSSAISLRTRVIATSTSERSNPAKSWPGSPLSRGRAELGFSHSFPRTRESSQRRYGCDRLSPRLRRRRRDSHSPSAGILNSPHEFCQRQPYNMCEARATAGQAQIAEDTP